MGSVLTRTLLADLPERGQGSARQVAALVGLAPFNRDTGQSRGPRAPSAPSGADAPMGAVCGVLSRATLRAIRCNPVSAAFYARLRKAGTAKNVAMVACMRKRLTILHAMLKQQTACSRPPAADRLAARRGCPRRAARTRLRTRLRPSARHSCSVLCPFGWKTVSSRRLPAHALVRYTT